TTLEKGDPFSEINEPNKTPSIDSQTKEYIDNACQRAISTLFNRVKELIDQQREEQQQWNEQLKNMIKNHFNQLQQVNLTNIEKQPDNNQLPEEDHTFPLTINSADTREFTTQGNYPPTSILNEIIVNIKPSDIVMSKDIQGFDNPLAAEIESRRLCILYTKYKFLAVMLYDEDCQLELTINYNSILLEQNVVAEGDNFDILATKRLRFNKLGVNKTEVL
ncbi:19842_t:CDS:2, partial [Cetraspora pellucida]